MHLGDEKKIGEMIQAAIQGHERNCHSIQLQGKDGKILTVVPTPPEPGVPETTTYAPDSSTHTGDGAKGGG